MLRLKELRKQKRESQAFIASLLNITQQAYANYESGQRRPDVETLALLAKHFAVSVDYLLGREETPAPVSRDGLEDPEILAYLQMIRDDPRYRMMFDLTRDATLEEIKATAAFLKALREQQD